MVSVKDVAHDAGVSVGTVSNVLNRPDSVSEVTRRRVEASIGKLGFVRNEAARLLRSGASRAIGLVVMDAANPFFSDMARGVEDAVDERGEVVLLGNSGGHLDRERRYLKLFEQQRVRGVLLSPADERLPDLSGLERLGIPVVFIDRYPDDVLHSSVSVDNVLGGRLAAAHLRDLGHRRLCFVGGPLHVRQPRERLDGFRAELTDTSATVEHISTPTLTVFEGRRIGEVLAARPPGERPTAIFAANDLLAIGLLNAFTSLGISVPGQVSLVGFDDIAFASTTSVPLTTLQQPALSIGREGARLLFEQLDRDPDSSNEPRRVRFSPRLIVRQSTAAPTA